MLHSMTGFGRCLVETAHNVQQWEVKSVNGRHLEIRWRLPLTIRGLEPRLEKIVRSHATRGKVDVSLLLQYPQDKTPGLRFHSAQAASMLESLQDLAAARGEHFAADYNALLHIPALWGDTSEEVDEETAAGLEHGLSVALEDWNEARRAEGRALGTDMRSRILRMEAWASLLAERAPAITEERAEALRERLADALAQCGQEPDDNRLLQEIAILADRLDVSEELTRLNTHLARMHDLLQNGKDAGRRLEFTLQECFREINTCGSKLPDVQLSRMVVDFKNELEKCREQVQNLE